MAIRCVSSPETRCMWIDRRRPRRPALRSALALLAVLALRESMWALADAARAQTSAPAPQSAPTPVPVEPPAQPSPSATENPTENPTQEQGPAGRPGTLPDLGGGEAEPAPEKEQRPGPRDTSPA